MGRDILGAAKTGSGKTLAFLVPVRTETCEALALHLLEPATCGARVTFAAARLGKNECQTGGERVRLRPLMTMKKRLSRAARPLRTKMFPISLRPPCDRQCKSGS